MPANRNGVEQHSPSVAIVIPTWDGVDLLERCLESLSRQRRQPDEVVVVDNGSRDGTSALVEERFPDVLLVRLPHNHGFAGGANRGIDAASPGSDVVLLNNDAVPDESWLEELVAAAEGADPRVGVFASKILDAEGVRIDSTGDFLNRAGLPVPRGRGEIDAGQFDLDADVLSACAGASYYRRDMLGQLQGFDEDFFAYFEDVDLCLRARALGWRIRYVHRAVVRHDIGATSSSVPGFARYHTLRNLWFLVMKNIPRRLLVSMLPALAAVQARRTWSAVREGNGRIAWRAHSDAARLMASMLGKRREIQRDSRIRSTELRSWLLDSSR